MSRRQLLDAQIPVVAFRSLGFQANVALARFGLAAARDDFSIYGQLNHAVAAQDMIMIPLARWFGAPFTGQATHPAFWMRPVRFELRAVDREQVPVTGVSLRIAPIQDLHFDGVRAPHSRRGDGIGPDRSEE